MFTFDDILAALATGNFENGPYAASAPSPSGGGSNLVADKSAVLFRGDAILTTPSGLDSSLRNNVLEHNVEKLVTRGAVQHFDDLARSRHRRIRFDRGSSLYSRHPKRLDPGSVDAVLEDRAVKSLLEI